MQQYADVISVNPTGEVWSDRPEVRTARSIIQEVIKCYLRAALTFHLHLVRADAYPVNFPINTVCLGFFTYSTHSDNCIKIPVPN